MCLDTNDPEMLRQRQDHPIPKMTIKRYQRSLLLHGPSKEQRIVSPRLASLARANGVMPGVAQKRGQFDPKHLIEVKAHDRSRRVEIEGGDFRVQNGASSVLQGGLNILPRQFRVAAQNGIP